MQHAIIHSKMVVLDLCLNYEYESISMFSAQKEGGEEDAKNV